MGVDVQRGGWLTVAQQDYYGNPLDGSIVKSHTLNGAMSLTDYGTYDEVVNLSDGIAF